MMPAAGDRPNDSFPSEWDGHDGYFDRVPETFELVPADYFRRLRKDEIVPDPARPLEVDVGCGEGTFLVALAAAHPERDFLGIERLLGRVRKTCRKAERQGLSNVRVLRLDSAYAVPWLLPREGVARLHLLFPDPWPKKRHHRRRLVRDRFIVGVHLALEPRGEWLFKSDHAEYFGEVVDAVRASGLFVEIDWEPGAFPYPATDFERHWLAQGKPIHAARFRKAGA